MLSKSSNPQSAPASPHVGARGLYVIIYSVGTAQYVSMYYIWFLSTLYFFDEVLNSWIQKKLLERLTLLEAPLCNSYTPDGDAAAPTQDIAW